MASVATTMQVHQFYIPNGNENVNYIIRCDETGTVAVVDPTEAPRTQAELEKLGWIPDMVLVTHHHWDHTDGIAELAKHYDCPVVGHAKDQHRIPTITQAVNVGDTITVGAMEAEVLAFDGHTQGLIAYYFREENALFSNDIVFGMGCGRLFEGTPEQMYASFQHIKSLPDETVLYAAHEYTMTNANFAREVLPENTSIAERFEQVKELRSRDAFTVPTTVRLEKATNPFMLADSVEQFAEWRAIRDKY